MNEGIGGITLAVTGRPKRYGVRKLNIWIDEEIARRLEGYVKLKQKEKSSIGRVTKTSVVEHALKRFLDSEQI